MGPKAEYRRHMESESLYSNKLPQSLKSKRGIEENQDLKDHRRSDSLKENYLLDNFKGGSVDLARSGFIEGSDEKKSIESLKDCNDYLTGKSNVDISEGRSFRNGLRELQSMLADESLTAPESEMVNETFDSKRDNRDKDKFSLNELTFTSKSRNSSISNGNLFESEDLKEDVDEVNHFCSMKDKESVHKSKFGKNKPQLFNGKDDENSHEFVDYLDSQVPTKSNVSDCNQSHESVETVNKQHYRTSTPKRTLSRKKERELDYEKRKDKAGKEKHISENKFSYEENVEHYRVTEINSESLLKKKLGSSERSKKRSDIGDNLNPQDKSLQRVHNESDNHNEIESSVDNIFIENDTPKRRLQRQGRLNNRAGTDKRTSEVSVDTFVKSDVNDDKLNSRNIEKVDDSMSKLNIRQSSFDDFTTGMESSSNQISKRMSRSATNISNISSTPSKGKSPSKSPQLKSFLSQDRDDTYTVPSSSDVLKELIYRQWLEKKKQKTKEEIKAKMAAQKKAQEEADAEARERKLVAKKTFDAWNNSKTETISSEKEIKQKAKLAEKEKLEESLQRKRDAEKYFESWKRDKDEKLKKSYSQKKREEREKDKEAFLEKQRSSSDALKAFESWKVHKAATSAEIKRKQEEEKRKLEEEKLQELERKQEAQRVFEEWKNKKSPRRLSSPPNLTQSERIKSAINGRKVGKMITSKCRSGDCHSVRGRGFSYIAIFAYLVLIFLLLFNMENILEVIVSEDSDPYLKLFLKWLIGFIDSVKSLRRYDARDLHVTLVRETGFRVLPNANQINMTNCMCWR